MGFLVVWFLTAVKLEQLVKWTWKPSNQSRNVRKRFKWPLYLRYLRTAESVRILKELCRNPRTTESVWVFKGRCRDPGTAESVRIVNKNAWPAENSYQMGFLGEKSRGASGFSIWPFLTLTGPLVKIGGQRLILELIRKHVQPISN